MSFSSGTQRLDWILSPEPALDPQGPGAGLSVGVLAVQGDFREHRVALERLGVRTREVRRVNDLKGVDGLIIPGGESTTISKLMDAFGLTEPVKAFHAAGGAVYGTCAGLITVASGTVEGSPATLGLMDIVARRNAFGRQVRSFEEDVAVGGIDGGPVRAVFIRAPWVESAGPDVEILASCRGHIVAARQGTVLVTAFHPELTDDVRLHRLFIDMIRDGRKAATVPVAASESHAPGGPQRVAATTGRR